MFNTYRGIRFGFNGFFNMPSETNYIYILYALLGYYYYDNREHSYKLLILLNLLISVLTGTKTVIFISLLVLFLLFFKKINRYTILICVSIISMLVLFSDKILKIIEPTKIIFMKIYEDQGFLSAITSFRFHNLKNTLNTYFYDTSISNVLMYNLDFINIRVEMEVFDLVFFWGVLGAILYVYFFIKINSAILKNRKDLYILLILILIASMAGKFLTNFTAIFLTYTFFTIKRPQNNL